MRVDRFRRSRKGSCYLEEETMKVVAIALFVFLAHVGIAGAADLRVLSGFGMKPVLDELGPQFERSMGHKLTIHYDSTGGMKRTIDSGEPFDLAIVTQALSDDLVKQAKVSTPVVIARSGVGISVRAGASKPAIDSAETFKRALLAAQSIAYSAEGATAKHFARIGDRLGIAGELKAKAKPQKNAEGVAQAVADGTAELGFSVISTIRATRGVELVGPVPPELQEYVVYSAAVGTAAKNTDGARALVRFLTDDRAAQTLRAKGLEPGAPR
jgi:molybdate transport system substrate-binding protein